MVEDTDTEIEERMPRIGSGRVDALFDDIEVSIESLDGYADELTNVRNRIEGGDGEAPGHVRNRVTQDADQLVEQADEAVERLREALESLKRTV